MMIQQLRVCGTLQAELKMQGLSKVGILNLSPGMVTTDLLMSGVGPTIPCSTSHCRPDRLAVGEHSSSSHHPANQGSFGA